MLPRRVVLNLETMGQQIKLARKRRKLSLSAIAERAQCSELTVMRVERGAPTVSLGIYARILYGLGLDKGVLRIAEKDDAGNALVNLQLLKRNQAETEDDVFD